MAGVVVAANFVSNRGLKRVGPKVIVPVGMILAAGAAGWLQSATVHGDVIAFTFLAILLAAGAVVTALLFPRRQ